MKRRKYLMEEYFYKEDKLSYFPVVIGATGWLASFFLLMQSATQAYIQLSGENFINMIFWFVVMIICLKIIFVGIENYAISGYVETKEKEIYLTEIEKQ